MNDSPRDERGAIAIIVALSLVMLLLFGAIVLDIGALVQEKRSLRNGADAAALAIARDCVDTSCGDEYATADDYVDENADDGAAAVDEVCGDAPSLSTCTDPPTVPEGAEGWVMVRDSSEEPDGGTEVPFSLAKVIGIDGETVRADAVAAWGSPSSITTIPLTFSECEWNWALTDLGLTVDDLVKAPTFPYAATTIYFHNTDEASRCDAGASGYDLPGGFGWLDDDNCVATVDQDSWVGDSTGNGVPNGCNPRTWVNKVVAIPIYDDCLRKSTDPLRCEEGANGEYHIMGFAGFHTESFRFPGGSNRYPAGYQCPDPPPPALPLSGNSAMCIQGHFAGFSASGGGFGGPDLGVTIVRLVG